MTEIGVIVSVMLLASGNLALGILIFALTMLATWIRAYFWPIQG